LTSFTHHDMIHMVMRMKNAETDSTKPLTVRIPEEEYEYLKEYAGTRHISMNWLVAEAIAEYRSKIERGQAIKEIQAFQERLRDGREEGCDSVDLLHRLREARSDLGDGSGEDSAETGSRLRPGQEDAGR